MKDETFEAYNISDFRELKNPITGRPMGRGMNKTDSLTWDDLRALRKLWPHTLVVKGILSPQDAVLAADCAVLFLHDAPSRVVFLRVTFAPCVGLDMNQLHRFFSVAL